MTEQTPAMSAEQQQYVSTLAQKKRLYAAQQTIQEAQDMALADGQNPQATKLANKLNAAEQLVSSNINQLYFQQKQIEEAHPEFKKQAVQHARNQALQQQRQSPQQNF